LEESLVKGMQKFVEVDDTIDEDMDVEAIQDEIIGDTFGASAKKKSLEIHIGGESTTPLDDSGDVVLETPTGAGSDAE
jgi:hypothetical protein